MRPSLNIAAVALTALLAASCGDDGAAETCTEDNYDLVMEDFYTCTETGDCSFDEECLQACYDDMCAGLDELSCDLEGTDCEAILG